MSILSLVSVLTLVSFPGDFELSGRSLPRLEQELSIGEAFNKCVAYASTASQTNIFPTAVLGIEMSPYGRIWSCQFGDKYTVEIDSQSGALQCYIDEASRGPSESSISEYKSVFPNETDIIQSAINLGQLLGLRRDSIVRKGSNLGDKSTGSFFSPYATVTFDYFYRSRPVNGFYSQYTFDIRTGHVANILQFQDFEVIHEDPSLSLEECVDLAKTAYTSVLGLYKRDPPQFETIPLAIQIVYCPTPTRSKQVTVCYAISFGNDLITIDATSGKTLQTFITKLREK